MLVMALFSPAAQADLTVGAAQVDTTPPAFNSAQDLFDFPEVDTARNMICPRSVYNGPRLWRFEEPYTDTDGSGDFNYPAQAGVPTPEPYCDYNHNNRWEGIYSSGGVGHLAKTVHDPIDARAVAFSNGPTTIVLVSVVAQGIFENYIREARTMAQTLAGQGAHQVTCGHIDEMVVSSNHNESSPDTVGIYGAPPDPAVGAFGLNSSIDEYYMDWLDEQIANSAVEACGNRVPGSLREVEFPVPPDLEQQIPRRFPTADDFGNHASIDNKVRVLQARDSDGDPVFTIMNLSDHNQDIGHSDSFEESHAMSSDWPGSFHRHLEQEIGGTAMFLAGAIGSQEDLITRPRIPDPPCDGGSNGCFAQVELTGQVIAGHVADQLANAEPVSGGAVSGDRIEFCAPLENNLFKAAFEAGLFGERQGYTNCLPTGRVGTEVHTSVAVLQVGDVQFISHPGEAFPALMFGGPWGIEDASCPNRANPPVPNWRAKAKYRFQVGLGDDLVGYMKPAWSFLYDTPGTFTPTDGCVSDPHNHSHALEDEAVGPTISNMVAENLSAMLEPDIDPAAEIRYGRYVKADGTLTDAYTAPQDQGAPGHWPTDAVAIWLTSPGSTNLNADPGHPDHGTIVALGGVTAFGSRQVDQNGRFMDFDGAEQPNGPDVTTRGMVVKTASGAVSSRYYVDVYPALTVTSSLGPAVAPEYPRPGSATPLRVPLVPEYQACTSPNSVHVAPLDSPACTPPSEQSSLLTTSAAGKGWGFARFTVTPGNPGTPANEADVSIMASATDVRNAGGGSSDYTGDVLLRTAMRVTDGGSTGGEPATVQDSRLDVPVACAASPNPALGSACAISTTANTLVPGFAQEERRTIISALSVSLTDAGLDGTVTSAPGPGLDCPPECGSGDEATFLRQGLFAP
jgi:hypothetical protein